MIRPNMRHAIQPFCLLLKLNEIRNVWNSVKCAFTIAKCFRFIWHEIWSNENFVNLNPLISLQTYRITIILFLDVKEYICLDEFKMRTLSYVMLGNDRWRVFVRWLQMSQISTQNMGSCMNKAKCMKNGLNCSFFVKDPHKIKTTQQMQIVRNKLKSKEMIRLSKVGPINIKFPK